MPLAIMLVVQLHSVSLLLLFDFCLNEMLAINYGTLIAKPLILIIVFASLQTFCFS